MWLSWKFQQKCVNYLTTNCCTKYNWNLTLHEVNNNRIYTNSPCLKSYGVFLGVALGYGWYDGAIWLRSRLIFLSFDSTKRKRKMYLTKHHRTSSISLDSGVQIYRSLSWLCSRHDTELNITLHWYRSTVYFEGFAKNARPPPSRAEKRNSMSVKDARATCFGMACFQRQLWRSARLVDVTSQPWRDPNVKWGLLSRL